MEKRPLRKAADIKDCFDSCYLYGLLMDRRIRGLEWQEGSLAKIFWDTNLFIYLYEGHPIFGEQVEQLYRRILARGDRLFTSALTVGEILVKPLSVGRPDLAEKYLGLFRQPSITVISFDLSAASFFARIRQDRTIRRPDAMQLACAAAAGVDLLITNDARFSQKAIPGINFISSLERAPL